MEFAGVSSQSPVAMTPVTTGSTGTVDAINTRFEYHHLLSTWFVGYRRRDTFHHFAMIPYDGGDIRMMIPGQNNTREHPSRRALALAVTTLGCRSPDGAVA